MAPKGPKPIFVQYSHVVYQIKVNEERIQWCKTFAPGACQRSKGGIFGPFYCHTSPSRLFQLEP